jgi:hypothetical protein
MRCLTGICIGLLALLTGVSANAGIKGEYSNELLRDCTAPLSGTFTSGFCLGYLKGAAEMSRLRANVPLLPAVCVPDALTVGQVRNLVVRYMEEHPEELHYASIYLVHNALEEAFPCPAKPAPK